MAKAFRCFVYVASSVHVWPLARTLIAKTGADRVSPQAISEELPTIRPEPTPGTIAKQVSYNFLGFKFQPWGNSGC